VRPRAPERAAERVELAARRRSDSDVAIDVHKFMDEANQHPMGRFYGV
jgi:hypothetical protein